MPNAISKYGWTDFGWTFGLENNSLKDTFYLADASQLESVLSVLLGPINQGFGSTATIAPMSHPRFTSFFCTDVEVLPNHPKGVQGNDDGVTSWQTSIRTPCTIQGGVKLECTFRPMDWMSKGGYPPSSLSPNHITEETFDYSAQVMQIISNREASVDGVGMYWMSNGQQCTNLRGAVKIIPKIDFYQKRILKAQIPCPSTLNASLQNQVSCIGKINSSTLNIGSCDQSNTPIGWPPGTVLCQSLPITRRWRFDGCPMWEVGIKLAIITLQDYCVDLAKPDYVTWNRLYHADAKIGGTAKPGWDMITFGNNAGSPPMYDTIDLNVLNDI